MSTAENLPQRTAFFVRPLLRASLLGHAIFSCGFPKGAGRASREKDCRCVAHVRTQALEPQQCNQNTQFRAQNVSIVSYSHLHRQELKSIALCTSGSNMELFSLTAKSRRLVARILKSRTEVFWVKRQRHIGYIYRSCMRFLHIWLHPAL